MDATPTSPGIARRAVTALLITALVLVLLPLLARPASAAATYKSGGFACQNTSFGRRVMAYTPAMTSSTGQNQMVYWSPDLYRFDGSRWALYDGTRPWNYGVANNYGLQYNSFTRGTWFTPANNSLQFVVYNNLPRGHYMIADFHRWGATGHYQPGSFVTSASAWSPYGGGGTYCTFS